MISLGKLKQGLYHLEIIYQMSLTHPKVSSINNFTTPPINLWHYRLGLLFEK